MDPFDNTLFDFEDSLDIDHAGGDVLGMEDLVPVPGAPGLGTATIAAAVSLGEPAFELPEFHDIGDIVDEIVGPSEGPVDLFDESPVQPLSDTDNAYASYGNSVPMESTVNAELEPSPPAAEHDILAAPSSSRLPKRSRTPPVPTEEASPKRPRSTEPCNLTGEMGVHPGGNSSRNDALQHGRRDITRFYCDNCSAPFTRRAKLQQHMILFHTPPLDYACDLCSGTFGTLTHLGQHKIRMHKTSPTLVKCDNCGACFGMRTTLENHNREQHELPQVAKCPTCRATFANESQLQRHKLLAHPKWSGVCCECGLEVKSNLKQHIRRNHSEDAQYKCTVCGAGFLFEMQRTIHMRRVHNVDIKRRNN